MTIIDKPDMMRLFAQSSQYFMNYYSYVKFKNKIKFKKKKKSQLKKKKKKKEQLPEQH